MMMMYFHFGITDFILFKQWKPENNLAMVFSCLAIFLLGVLYEGIKAYRLHLRRAKTDRTSITLNLNGEGNPGRLSSAHLLQTTLHILQTAISYSLMLVAMTFNVFLCMSVVLGMGFGYFIFGRTDVVPTTLEACCD